jgi:hypothetical protein
LLVMVGPRTAATRGDARRAAAQTNEAREYFMVIWYEGKG